MISPDAFAPYNPTIHGQPHPASPNNPSPRFRGQYVVDEPVPVQDILEPRAMQACYNAESLTAAPRQPRVDFYLSQFPNVTCTEYSVVPLASEDGYAAPSISICLARAVLRGIDVSRSISREDYAKHGEQIQCVVDTKHTKLRPHAATGPLARFINRRSGEVPVYLSVRSDRPWPSLGMPDFPRLPPFLED